jgi:formate dehydrogenase alpha subunit
MTTSQGSLASKTGEQVKEISLIIDGQKVKAQEEMTVLQAAEAAGIYIPTLCADNELEPYGACRLCIVEIEGMEGLPPSCMTTVTEGMVVHTDTPQVNSFRRNIMELLLADHPMEDCLICFKNQQCKLQELAAYFRIEERRMKKTSRAFPIDQSNPFFYLDHNKCIVCAKCVRVCNEVQGDSALDLSSKSHEIRVAPVGEKPWIESSCESCGACVAICPAGALVPRSEKPGGQQVKTICPYCGVGCGIYLGVRGGVLIGARGDPENPVNKGKLCVKGRFGSIDFVHHPDRLKLPLIRQDGKLVTATWEEALDLVVSKLAKYKGDQFAAIASAKCTNEENYLIQKFARKVMGTNNVDHCARLCHAPSVAGLAQSFGSGAMTNSINEISNAACILAIGTNTTETHPVIGLQIKKAVRDSAKLIVANPRRIDLCRIADLWLQHRPGTDVPLLMGMMRVIVDEGLQDQAFIDERCEDFEAFKESLHNFSLDKVEEITGVPRDKIAAAARLYATTKPGSILYAMGITQHSHGTDNVIATANLAMLTGNVGKTSTGVNPLRGHNNVQGACDMGALPNVYPGYQSVADAKVKEKFETAWSVALSSDPGLTLTEIFDAAYEGKIKAIYLLGENPVLSEPDAKHVEEALNKLDFLVVQDIFLTETARLADIVLPGVTFAEKDGTFTNTERRVQRIHKAIEPVSDSRPDWWITQEIAKRLDGKGFDFDHPSEIMDEIARLTPSYGGISYRRLEKGGLQWPCPDKAHPGTTILHTQQFTRGKGRFMPLDYRPSLELPDKEYPLLLTTGRVLYQFHTGTMTRKVSGLNTLRGEELVEMNPADAVALDITDGEAVRVTSRRGHVIAKTKVTEDCPPSVIFMTFHFAESATNLLTNPALDPLAKIPELKVCTVKVEKVQSG